ncbi:transmembrane protein KIAA1109 homolog isoform X2 [Daphnia pulicaria]|nr:transmembrane protein KIAA1109 homolog isoform X2 [Daphnia pulicaria]
MIFIHGDLGWDQLQLMISKSTTADLIKMYLKLDEFFQQQFRSSRRIFSTLSATGGGHSIRRKGAAKNVATKIPGSAEPAGPSIEAQHHRHWQGVLRRVAGLEIATLPTPLPMTGTILGGTMELHGGHISLACFHGVNFKSKSWALFSLKDPCVSFATEAQEIPGDADPKDIHVVQNLSFSLGLSGPGAHTPVGIGYRVIEQQQQQNSPASMATVCRISRTQLYPPQFKTIQDWFLYAFANSRIDAMERFPSLERERERSNSGAPQLFVKTPDYHHAAEIIFAFPSLQLHLKSEHLQTGVTPSLTEKPSVDCSFITDFEDHIFVTVDADAFFFLHDLISSYVREKERVILASVASNQRTQSPELQKAAVSGTAGSSSLSEPSSGQGSPAINNAPLSLQLTNEDEKKRRLLEQIDWRNYECKTWHLEPTVRLLSWAGKRIEPYGVEYILNKLGFSQARTTIPKWVQRGAMDPLDKILSLVLSRTIAAQRAKESQTSNSTAISGAVTGGGGSSGAGLGSNNAVNNARPAMK